MKTPTVLLVEDDPVQRYAIATKLRQRGVPVVEAADAIVALNILDRPDYEIDVAVIDIILPVGQPHGVALGHMARTRGPEILVIYITGHTYLAVEENIGSPVFHKPLDIDILAAAITDNVGRPQT